MPGHAMLSADRWARFSLDQQVLMIANEMNRAQKQFDPADRDRRVAAYARALQLADLTIEVNPRRTLRRELLRWRDLIAALYIAPAPDPSAHTAALRALLRLRAATAKQIPLVTPHA
jgi:predicted RNA-binding Zn ribbon-like protein